jgi:hypothetical protein
METIALESLTSVVGGAGVDPAKKWGEIQKAASPHCPKTVAANPEAPTNRAQAQKIGSACIAEMGSFKAEWMGGKKNIDAGIDEAFPAQ